VTEKDGKTVSRTGSGYETATLEEENSREVAPPPDSGTAGYGGGFNRSTQHLLILQDERYAYGGERTAEVHAEAEGRALGPLEERSMYSRHCASARGKEQERRVPRIGFEWRHYPSSTSASADRTGAGGA